MKKLLFIILLIGCSKEEIDVKHCYKCEIHTWNAHSNQMDYVTQCGWTQKDADEFESTAFNAQGTKQTINCVRQ